MNRIEEKARGAGGDNSAQPVSSLHAWLLGVFVCVTVAMAVALGGSVDLGDSHAMQATTRPARVVQKSETGVAAERPAKEFIEQGGGDAEQGEQSMGNRQPGRYQRSIALVRAG